VKVTRIAGAVALIAVAAVLACFASDVLSWRDAIRNGDDAFARRAADATWKANTVLPSDPARGVLGLGLPLRFRSAAQSFAAVQEAGQGYDNGLSETRTRGELEAELVGLAQSRNHVIASRADNMLGILAFTDATPTGPVAAAPIDESVADFQAAIRLDPTNADAKFNLEVLLHQLLAKGIRPGANDSAGGLANGHHGAGGGLPGTGY
jgi:hypothetical protein